MTFCLLKVIGKTSVISTMMVLRGIDALLIKPSTKCCEVQGYAEDITVLIRGKFEEKLSERLPQALNFVVD